MGRHSSLTDRVHNKIVSLVKSGCFPDVAAAQAGVIKKTYLDWIRKGNQLQPFFAGKEVVLIGALGRMDRKTFEATIVKVGGSITPKVEKASIAVLGPRAAGARIRKAEELGLTILNEGQFFGHLDNERYIAFSLAIDEAEAEAENRNVTAINKAAINDHRAAMTFLERRFPQRWNQKFSVEHTGQLQFEIVPPSPPEEVRDADD